MNGDKTQREQYRLAKYALPVIKNKDYLFSLYKEAKIIESKSFCVTYEIFPNHFAKFYFLLKNGKRVDWAGSFDFKDVLLDKWSIGEFYTFVDGEKKIMNLRLIPDY